MAPLERAIVVSYRLSIVTVALYVTIRPQFAMECLRRSQINRRWVTLGQISRSFRRRPQIFGSAESEHPRLTNGEIISEEFQPMWSQSANVTDGRTDRQTDRPHAITRPRFALKSILRECPLRGLTPRAEREKSQKISDSHRNDVSPLTQDLRYRAACNRSQSV